MSTAVRFGILLGACLSLWVLVEYAMGFHSNSPEIGRITGYFSLVFSFVVILTALRDRQRFFFVLTPTKDLISTGFRVALYSSLFLTAFMLLYGTVIHPGWIEEIIEWERRKLILGGATDEQIALFNEQARARNNVWGSSLMGLLGNTGVGVLMTFLCIPVVRYLQRYHSEE